MLKKTGHSKSHPPVVEHLEVSKEIRMWCSNHGSNCLLGVKRDISTTVAVIDHDLFFFVIHICYQHPARFRTI